MKINPKNFTPRILPLSRSLKVIRIDMDQLAIYDFPLMFHSNHGPILYRFRDKW